MDPPMPKRDPLWAEEADIQDARKREDDEFWIEIMKKKFHRTEDGEDSGIESDENMEVALLDREAYVCTVDLNDDFDSEDQQYDISNNPTNHQFDLGTCYVTTRSTLQEQSQQERGEPREDNMETPTNEESQEEMVQDELLKKKWIKHIKAMGVKSKTDKKNWTTSLRNGRIAEKWKKVTKNQQKMNLQWTKNTEC